ncbi:MAG: HAD family hydrolase [Apibacter sp.]|uniref:Haloacid dehalogenase superfamily, subfamily IA, variant 3 with third motif having DD or ED/haloacid dehalogenase superfamily, subfamily IA, variant 1 with third motif having Dx(3-4)D or Dx(3-4)E n=1 Tax=Apibacter mensalis TaxID=1586267 RepID=A0A0X3ANU5_9FLAO|nr:HAD family hydrolase [Apibacter mensalis]MCO6565682.1 HAD family hydrolase [Apibacter sp.]CVK16031.1 haloacid dehalogenase superfamily, subfamily IA, variant 3 with third motif having DD or ED/haloacid dehalogenase superfamily, subfamily IA, variant 1 with third motif having Dx(3-4)D or Dx(3-4)E [Apibacter mensalis]
MINTVIFDMDGVIVNTEPIHELSFKKHFNEIGLNISQEEYDTFRGLSTRNLYQNLKQKYGLKQKVEELVLQKRSIFNKIFQEDKELDLLPGVRNLIESLYKDNFQLILATSSARVTLTKIFDRFGLFPYFKHIVSGEDFPNSKPDPTIFLEAVKLSGQPKENCIVIEDSTQGVIAANRAGIFCIGYRSKASGDQDLSTANKIISDFSILNSDTINTVCLVK